jgi:hypothetical protein
VENCLLKPPARCCYYHGRIFWLFSYHREPDEVNLSDDVTSSLEIHVLVMCEAMGGTGFQLTTLTLTVNADTQVEQFY